VTPLVTVGIPTYNNPEGLYKTLKCITRQSYKNLEIIVSDNHSENPEVQAVISKFSMDDMRVQMFRQSVNIGVDANYRFVIDNAHGNYFMFAQDDDYWTPTYLEACVNWLEANPAAPVASGAARYLTGDERKSDLHFLQNLSVYKTIGNGDMGLVCMGVWNREAFLKYEVRLPVYVLGGDHITVAHAMMGSGQPEIAPLELYTKGYKPGRFQVCFINDFWYSFRSWWWLMKTLVQSPHIPKERKLLLPVVAITNLARACAVTGVQVVVNMPDNPLKTWTQKRFFGAN